MPRDDNAIQAVLHWRPAGYRSGDDSTASGGEKKALVPTSPQRLDTPPAVSTPRATRVWDVKMPPAKKTMVGGRLIPTMGGTVGVSKLLQKKRRISLEIHVDKGEYLKGLNESRSPNTEVVQGLLRGESMMEMRDHEVLNVGEKVIVRLLKPGTDHEAHDERSEEGDSHSVSTLGISGADEEADTGMWTQAHIYDLDDVHILKAKRGGHCQIKFGHGSDTQVREVNFDSEKEAHSFCQVIDHLRGLQSKRTEERVRQFRTESPDSKPSSPSASTSQIQLLVEIVSGTRLPIADGSTSDPYVIVRMAGEEVHRTKPLYNTTNPIWTVKSGSLFLLSKTPEEFFATSSGLSFIIKDYDAVGTNDVLGKVVVGHEELLHGNGERNEYPLLDTLQKHHPGRLVLRFRKATSQDVDFMERLKLAQKSDITGVYGDETLVPPRVTDTSILKREHRTVDHKLQHRVKPEPDPERPEETKWMTSAEIDAESEKPSKKWIETGTGQIGKLYVEVLACDGLPNMDTPVVGGGKTDAFACLVYGDSIVNTEVINDVLSPRWMPWTQRAFVFNIMHPSPQLMVGVFDYDSPLPTAEHDPIGRAAVDVTNFLKDTVYTLYYDLYTSAIVKKRKSKGQIKLRIRIEIPNGMKCLLAAIKLPPENYINVPSSRDFRVATFVFEGKYNVHQFSTDRLAEHVEELKEYQSLLPIFQEAALTVVFWRGHYPVILRVPQCPPLPGGDDRRLWERYTKQITIRLPLHSVTAFVGGVLLADDFNFLPSFILFAVAWLLLATSSHVNDNPSPWSNRRSFFEIMHMVVGNSAPVNTIQPYENDESIQQYLAERDELEKRREEAKKKKEDEQRLHDEVTGQLAALDEGGEVQMGTRTSGGVFGVSVNPLKPILFPMQQNLELACRIVRIVRSFVTWEESISAFWIVILCMLGGLLLLFVPWAYILRWIFRVIVWVCLGPWMKLVDWLYVKKPRSTEEEQKESHARLKSKYKDLMTMALARQTVREEKTKLKDMKRYMFGHYLAVVPRWKQSRYSDNPKPASHSSPFVANTSDAIDIVCRKHGQYLSGDMIPKREIDEPTEASALKDREVQDYGSTKQHNHFVMPALIPQDSPWQPSQIVGKVAHKMDPANLTKWR